ncbi:insulinase family protein [Loktanella sp. IMCC34160]|uniref:M16 family metallopeptidase n=1 Tax=Loktanella sp. IMCC34160 TaxID=2510646 RepID=UPI00101D6275|nr:pitrilysin family protein [Loktanella sp. IMCC34160]RYG91212.1 insulinase family protein [Loktanella sp. IMCC34160]
MFRFAFALFLALASTARAEVEIQEITSPGGIDAWLVEEHSIPFVAIEIHFDGGSALDLPGKRGATNLMTGLIEEGSGDMDARAFQSAREALAASYEFDVYDDGLTVSARFLTENRDQAVDLLRQALVDPRFDQDALDRVRAQVLSGIASDEKNPNRIAGRAFYSAAFGDHPYGTADSGTVETVTGLTRDDMFDAHRNVLVRDRAMVSAVGDITAEDLGALIDTLLGDLPEGGAPLPDRVDFGLTGGITVVPYDTPQSVALFGHSGMERDDEDFFAAYILNTILGGNGPQSILMEEVREKRGLTYGIYTYLVPKDHTEMWLGSVASANDRMADTVVLVQAEWQRIAEEGITQDQLDAAKTYLTGAYPLRFDGNGPIASIMVGMQVQGLPTDYVIHRNDYINAVTLEDVNRVAAEYLRPEALHFTIVGQPVGLESTQ